MTVSDLQIFVRGAAIVVASAMVLLSAAPSFAMGPGNITPNLTYPGDGHTTLSTRDSTCGLFGCRSER